MPLHPLSFFPSLLRMVFGETGGEMAIGTGFFYEHNGDYYLITNGHCVTGINPENNMRISDHAGYPTVASVGLLSKHQQTVINPKEPPRPIGITNFDIPLYMDEHYAQPTWFTHPAHGYRVDVVAIPVCKVNEVPSHLSIFPLNSYPFEVEPAVGDEVFVLGYPFGITDSFEMPIWKKGSIASEPFFPFKGLPMMLIDTATRSGMSGSPVIIKRTGVHGPEEDERFGTAAGFAGVYSGRYGVENDKLGRSDVQLGIVWKKEVIQEIIEGKYHGTIAFQNL
ncbi:MAG TPA: serine protease [Hymenobacter sp.]|uniref:S1 family peptidase n=1 Tax=Hymenobacter sp. TaxID=1898978 RepID=UPI002ED8CF0F